MQLLSDPYCGFAQRNSRLLETCTMSYSLCNSKKNCGPVAPFSLTSVMLSEFRGFGMPRWHPGSLCSCRTFAESTRAYLMSRNHDRELTTLFKDDLLYWPGLCRYRRHRRNCNLCIYWCRCTTFHWCTTCY